MRNKPALVKIKKLNIFPNAVYRSVRQLLEFGFIREINKYPIKYAALVDSGADFCIFDAEIGELLGIDVRSGRKEKFGGIQSVGAGNAYLHSVVLNIGGWLYKTKVSFSYDMAPHGHGILGQKGFFDIFKVKFDLSKESIELTEIK